MKALSKAIILIITPTIMFCSCKKDNNRYDSALTGKWKLVANRIGTGGPGQWIAVADNQSTYVQFDANGTLEGTCFLGYIHYMIKDSTTLVFTKTDNTTQSFFYQINEGFLDLDPAGPIVCTEGCTSRFIRFWGN